ncbi:MULTISPECIES: helix-turn-helix domain-containing protein [Lentilactobacillus]|uniref:Helix-turn-helix domain-containing protein n=1 Tax=Lentilactobacillus hilgardii TaxID=1588 RepID=A0A6P1E8J4_LENHI|nr:MULTISPECIES: helix-turn-helix transcriptional regulator [Lentilactobacillus]MQM78845.1 helix-turn-helix transcriptional regulator [Lentilactobacillus buchneri]MQM88836.1 helix-turn-helix transcriptional regulator [Lentilactobacillus buchneri]MQN21048.1 helix-turn-helix transcriptional regulator [Lentilactobacillus buchneri]QHB52470.1 helix-turn-helix domain-containing protein [Lentilactobacillus hilgardii]
MWEQIQSILEQKHLTINKLANMMGLKSNSLLYSFKNGKIKKPSFELMEKIADVLNVSMDEFRRK